MCGFEPTSFVGASKTFHVVLEGVSDDFSRVLTFLPHLMIDPSQKFSIERDAK